MLRFLLNSASRTKAGIALVLALAAGLPGNGCVTKAAAAAQARQAFLAGQQQAMQTMKMEQARGPSVTFVGPVKNPIVAWTEGLTLAKAIIAAGYEGPEPSDIVIMRKGTPVRVDPNQLLKGEDVPLETGDVVNIR
jgi:hypothetical protein